MKALLLEDQKEHIEKATILLKAAGYTVEHYLSVKDAEKNINKKYDIYVIDNRVYGPIRGIVLAMNIKEQMPDAKIILNSMDDLSRTAKTQGMQYTAKDYKLLEELISEISGIKISKPEVYFENEYLEASLEVLHTFLVPDNFAEGITTLESLLERSKELKLKNISSNLLKAIETSKEMQKNISSKTNPFDEDYVISLSKVRDLLLDYKK